MIVVLKRPLVACGVDQKSSNLSYGHPLRNISFEPLKRVKQS